MALDVTALVTQLQSAPPAQRLAAAEQLTTRAEEAQAAAVALAVAAGDPLEELAEAAAGALESMGPPQPADVAKLSGLLANSAAATAYWCATLLGRLGPEAASAAPALAKSAVSHQDMAARERSVWALGQIGSPAKASLPDLQRLAGETGHARLARLAAEAVRLIGQ